MTKLVYADCLAMIERGHAYALKEKGRPISIAIVDPHGDLIAFGRVDGAPIRTCNNAICKAFSAVYMGRDTHEFNKMLSDTGMQSHWYGDERVVGLLGGMLIKDGDTVIGGIGVSGLLPQEDMEVGRHILQARGGSR